jgi:hypothetical protein
LAATLLPRRWRTSLDVDREYVNARSKDEVFAGSEVVGRATVAENGDVNIREFVGEAAPK